MLEGFVRDTPNTISFIVEMGLVNELPADGGAIMVVQDSGSEMSRRVLPRGNENSDDMGLGGSDNLFTEITFVPSICSRSILVDSERNDSGSAENSSLGR